MQSFDQLHRYLFQGANVRGEMVRLQESYQAILDSYPYPQAIQKVLGELMAVTSLLTATLKFEGDISVQLQSEGVLKYAVVNGNNQQQLRGVARWDESVETLPEHFSELFEKGYMVITLSPKDGERFQGVVALDKPTLAECIEGYFARSEQLPTRVFLYAKQDAPAMAGGFLLQILPGSAETTDPEELESFEHLAQLTETMTQDELFALPAEDVLYRLYHQEDVELFEPQSVVFKCTCSRERSAGALVGIDKEELMQMIAEEGAVKMNCQFCHTEYSFDAIDVESIHAGTFGSSSAAQ